jgi:cohesin loading factor subunit SCC2
MTSAVLQVSSLDDVNSTNTVDNHGAKAIALDHLGVIAARIQSNTLKIEQGREFDGSLRTMDEARFIN